MTRPARNMMKRAREVEVVAGMPRRRPETTVAATIVLDVLKFLERRGVTQVVDATGFAITAPQPHDRVAGSVMERLWEAGGRLTGDNELGLHTGESFNPGALDILGYVLLSCPTVRDVLDRLSRYAMVLNDGLRVTVSDVAAFTTCRFEAAEGRPNYLLRSPRQPMESMAAGVAVSMRRVASRAIEPVEVAFAHDAPASTEEHARIFGPVVRFGQGGNWLRFRAADLAQPLTSSNPALLARFEQHADAVVASLGRHGPVSYRVGDAIRQCLRGVAPDLEMVSSMLGMSTRSIQRALREEGTSFQRLLNEIQTELARQHLGRGAYVSEVAFLLGFSEPAAFSRAFRRWTGSTPRAVLRRDWPRTRHAR